MAFSILVVVHVCLGGFPASLRAQVQHVDLPLVPMRSQLVRTAAPQVPHATSVAHAACPQCALLPARTDAYAIDSVDHANTWWPKWKHRHVQEWSPETYGEYIGPARSAHVTPYRVRVDDQLIFVYRLTRERIPQAYRLGVGDTMRMELLRDESVTRDLTIQPDGTILVPYLGAVMAAERSAEQLQRELTELLKEHYKNPIVLVTPLTVNTRLEDLRSAVDRRYGAGGQAQTARVIPDGTVQLPGIGVVCVQGMTLNEIKEEVDARYEAQFGGLEVTPILEARAPRFIYVLGEVSAPGRFELTGPTSLMQAIALAGGWNPGANLRQVVVFRRGEDWRLKAVMLNITGALHGQCPLPSDEIWLRDSDIVLLPKRPIRVIDDAIQLVFTEGLYAMFPFLGFNNAGFGQLTRL